MYYKDLYCLSHQPNSVPLHNCVNSLLGEGCVHLHIFICNLHISHNGKHEYCKPKSCGPLKTKILNQNKGGIFITWPVWGETVRLTIRLFLRSCKDTLRVLLVLFPRGWGFRIEEFLLSTELSRPLFLGLPWSIKLHVTWYLSHRYSCCPRVLSWSRAVSWLKTLLEA